MTRVYDPAAALLTYSLNTTPTPVRVSGKDGTPSNATLVFVISCPEGIGTLTVKSIVFNLPIGDPSAPDPTDLAESAADISCSVVSSDGHADTWTSTPGVAPGSFLITPDSSGVIADQSLTVTFTGIVVSPVVGTAEIQIIEDSDGPSQPREHVAHVAKFPQDFYARNFTPDKPEVQAGERVRFTWDVSPDAVCKMYFGSQPGVPVTDVRTWLSPAVNATTNVWLEASATVGGQTVRLKLIQTITVAGPKMVSFSAVPEEIDYNESVTLQWRSDDADGVYLFSGEFKKETLPAISDPANPKTMQPQFNVPYKMQAFKRAGPQEQRSSAVDLPLTFKALEMSLTADPETLDQTHSASVVSWVVRHATSVSFQNQPVEPVGSQSFSPGDDTTYSLVATWVDGQPTVETVDVKIVRVRVKDAVVDTVKVTKTGQFDMSSEVAGHFTVDNATGCTLSEIGLWFEQQATFYGLASGPVTYGPGTTPGTFLFKMTFDQFIDWSTPGALELDYTFVGAPPCRPESREFFRIPLPAPTFS